VKPALARALLYKFLSRLFDYPRRDWSEETVAEVRIAARERSLHGPFQAVARALKSRSLESLEQEYVRLFGHVGRAESPAYETGYGVAHAFQQTADLGDIVGFYRAHGLRPACGERPDHIAVELEFGAFLAVKEAMAGDRSGEVRDFEKRFLCEHVGRWAPSFSDRIAAEAGRRSLFERAARLLKEFMESEFREFGAAAPGAINSLDVSPIRFAPEGACSSCSLGPVVRPEEIV
jgi:TorA maturation chaperone TorD